jgi:hypothetical protein
MFPFLAPMVPLQPTALLALRFLKRLLLPAVQAHLRPLFVLSNHPQLSVINNLPLLR